MIRIAINANGYAKSTHETHSAQLKWKKKRIDKEEEIEGKTRSQVRSCEIEVEEIYAYMPWLGNTCTIYDRYTHFFLVIKNWNSSSGSNVFFFFLVFIWNTTIFQFSIALALISLISLLFVHKLKKIISDDESKMVNIFEMNWNMKRKSK